MLRSQRPLEETGIAEALLLQRWRTEWLQDRKIGSRRNRRLTRESMEVLDLWVLAVAEQLEVLPLKQACGLSIGRLQETYRFGRVPVLRFQRDPISWPRQVS